MDLLASTLTEHEKNLDSLIGRLEKICESLSRLGKAVEPREPPKTEMIPHKEEVLETLIYMKLKINRPTEELKLILDSLKE